MPVYARGEYTGRVGLAGYGKDGDHVGELDCADERAVDRNTALGLAAQLGGEGQLTGTAFASGTTVPVGSWLLYDDSGYPFYRKTTGTTSITFGAASGDQDLYAILTLQAGVSPDLIDEGLTGITFQTVAKDAGAPANHALKLGTGAVTASSFTSFTYAAGIYRAFTMVSHDHTIVGAAIPIAGLAAAVQDLFGYVDWGTPAAETGDTITVAGQIKDLGGNSLAAVITLTLRVSDTEAGAASATATLSAAAAPVGTLLEGSGTATVRLQTDSNGAFNIKCSETAAASRYLNVAGTFGTRIFLREFETCQLTFT